jgi:hypothetical protein
MHDRLFRISKGIWDMFHATTRYEPGWETTEQGWHAVVSLGNMGHWAAYIEFDETAPWRIWAGRMFATMREAQEWCQGQIAYQVQRSAEVNGLGIDEAGECWMWGNVEPMYHNDFMAW